MYALLKHVRCRLTSCAVLEVRVELFDVRRTKFVLAHTSPLAALTLSMDGKLLATASERGTLVRIHATHDGSKLQVDQSGGRDMVHAK